MVFTDVMNHLQGPDVFTDVMNHLQGPDVFTDVMNHLQALNWSLHGKDRIGSDLTQTVFSFQGKTKLYKVSITLPFA